MTFYRRPSQPVRPPRPKSFLSSLTLSHWFVIIVAVVIVLFAVIYYHSADAPELPPGIYVHENPELNSLDYPQPFYVEGYTIIPKASIRLRARVLSVAYYPSGFMSKLSPVDYALGWGQMSDSSVLGHYDINQGDRWYAWRYEGYPPVADHYVITHSRNVHLIPANESIKETMFKVRKNNIISMSGFLVFVRSDDNQTWNSHLSLEGQGNRTCLLVWVDQLSIVQ